MQHNKVDQKRSVGKARSRSATRAAASEHPPKLARDTARPENPTAKPRRGGRGKAAFAKDGSQTGPRPPAAIERPPGGHRFSSALADRRERVAKIIARAGLCSRRDAEAWIAQGRVAVNGKVLTSPAIALGPADHIMVDGKPLARRQRTRLFLFHKPRGLVTTNKDPEGRPTIFDHLCRHVPEAPRLMSIGRLDINTEGLLLLTNDGGLARILELPSTGWLRRYRVRANGETTQALLDGLAKGVMIDGMRYAGIEAVLDRVQGANCWLTLGLREGKNREIKRILEPLGLTVNRLIRISFGPFQLGDLPEGKVEEVRTRVLRDQLGPALMQAAGLDFDAPIDEAATDRGSAPKEKLYPKHGHAEAKSATTRPSPGPRKHVSALRVEEKHSADEDGRRRIERAATVDRKGRAITIERRVTAEALAHPTTPGAPKGNRGADGDQSGRKNFAERPQGRRNDQISKQRHKGRQKPARGLAPSGNKPHGRS